MSCWLGNAGTVEDPYRDLAKLVIAIERHHTRAIGTAPETIKTTAAGGRRYRRLR